LKSGSVLKHNWLMAERSKIQQNVIRRDAA
jgi:hypothetical protein